MLYMYATLPNIFTDTHISVLLLWMIFKVQIVIVAKEKYILAIHHSIRYLFRHLCMNSVSAWSLEVAEYIKKWDKAVCGSMNFCEMSGNCI